MLFSGQELQLPVGGNGGEAAVEGLGQPVGAQLPLPAPVVFPAVEGSNPGDAGGVLPQPGAVSPIFAEMLQAQGPLRPVTRLVEGRPPDRVGAGPGRRVHRSAVIGSHHVKPVGVKERAGNQAAPAFPSDRAQQVGAGGAQGAAPQVQLEPRGRGRLGEGLNHASQSRAPVEAGTSPGDHLDALQAGLVQLAPIDPTSEGIVERCPVPQHQGAADAAGSDPPQGHPLAGGVGHQAAAAPKEAEGRNPAQGVVHGDCRGLTQLRFPQHRDGRGDVSPGARGAGGGDRQRLHHPPGNQRVSGLPAT